MLKKLKDILNTYTDEELEDMELWVNSSDVISYIFIDKDNINLVTSDTEIKIAGGIEQEGSMGFYKED